MSRIIDNPRHWRKRAQETRALTDKIDDVKTKRTLLQVAEAYDRLAERAEGRERTPDKRKV